MQSKVQMSQSTAINLPEAMVFQAQAYYGFAQICMTNSAS